MIEYADREFYEKMFHGKVIPENAFPGMILKASIFIKFITFSRADNMVQIPEEVKLATCAVESLQVRIMMVIALASLPVRVTALER